MEAFEYIQFVNLDGSVIGLLLLSTLFVAIAIFRPFWAIAILCIYTELPWSASWKPFVTLYPIYPLSLVLILRYARQIGGALLSRCYGIPITLSMVLMAWILLSPLIYPAFDGFPVTFSQNPNFFRASQTIIILLLLPAVLRTRVDINKLIHSMIGLLMSVHVLLIIAVLFFAADGYRLADVHRMQILNTPPVYWESGLLIIFLAYLLIQKETMLIMLGLFGVLASVGLVVGNSRARVLATVLSLLYFLRRNVSIRMFSALALFLFLLMGGALIVPNSAKDYLSVLVKGRVEQSTKGTMEQISNARLSQFAAAYTRWKKSPWVGVGSGYTMPITYNERGKRIRVRVHTHFLEVLAAQGMIGVAVLLFVLGFTIRNAIITVGKRFLFEEDGRLIFALFVYGVINWCFKESWGITYAAIAMLQACYIIATRTDT